MTKKEMIKTLCKYFGYMPEFFEKKSFGEVRKILSAEKRELRESSPLDDADLSPDGKFPDEDDEDSI